MAISPWFLLRALPPWRSHTGGTLRTLLLLAFIGVVLPLKDVRVVIPRAVVRHEDAVLRCLYDMEGENPYQIKWYKGQNEFFRYTPGEKPPEKFFHLKGIKVSRDRSNSTTVTLHKVNTSAEGRYACEVSADSPSFATAIIADDLTVVEVPRNGPNIHGLEPRYRLGDVLKADCTTGPSKPRATLSFKVNGQQSVAGMDVRDIKTREEADGRHSSMLHMELRLLQEHFGTDNKLKIRCQGSIFDVYNKVDERSVELKSTYLTPPNVLETNQPTRDELYIETLDSHRDRKRPLHGRESSGASPSGSVALTALLFLATVAFR